MGCNQSKKDKKICLNLLKVIDDSICGDFAPRDAAAVADPPNMTNVIAQLTTIQDLPPLLLTQVFCKYLTWEDVHGSIALVCQAWRQMAEEVTPQQLSFEFDLIEKGAEHLDARTESKSLLQLLLSQPSRLLERLTGQPAIQQEPSDAELAGNHQTSTEHLRQKQDPQLVQNASWERWLVHHGIQLQDFAISITNLDSNCASAQCQLKETLLRALADSATLQPALMPSTSSSSCNGAISKSGRAHRAASVSCHLSDSAECCSDQGRSSSCNSTCSSDCLSFKCSPPCSKTGSLQLKSLHLKVPLFECDVLLLAHGVCAKAPQLKELSLVGYSNSGTVKTRKPGSSCFAGMKSSKHRLPITRDCTSNLTNKGLLPVAAAAASQCSSAPASRPDLTPTGHAPHAQYGTQPWTAIPSSGRGGFITGTSLKQLMTAMPKLERLTFACRQLYKLNWLAPATQLTYLSLRDCSLGGDLVKQLAGLDLPKLRAVDLSGSKGLGGLQANRHLQQLTRVAGGQLEQVDISGWDLSTAANGSRQLPHIPSLRNLCVLKMECCSLQSWAVQPGQLQHLTHLSLSGNPLDMSGVEAACSMTQLRHLELAFVVPKELALLPHQQAGQGARCWSGMRSMPHLTNLNLAGNYWPDKSLPDRSPVPAYRAFKYNLCGSLASMPRLAAINLSACKFPYSKMTHLLAHLPRSIREVVLDDAADGIKRGDLEALQQLPNLRMLSVCQCNVRDKHVSVLSELTNLQRLLLRDNALGIEGRQQLLQGCSQLAELDVSRSDSCSTQATYSRCN